MIQNASVEIQKYLESGEEALWTGQPHQGLMFHAGDILLIPLSLFWGGGVLYWEYMALTTGAPLFFVLWGIPFLLVGIYLVVGRFSSKRNIERKAFMLLRPNGY